jgi:GNAT superfamily N-acetyltransferase
VSVVTDLVIRPATTPGDLGWMVMANGELYAREYGWDTDAEALMARIVGDFAVGHDPQREAAWIAELEDRRVGCVMCVADDEHTARLRILLVEAEARGLGAGAALVDGYEQMVLWTNDVLTSARRLYESRGFVLVEESPHHSFGQDLVGQTWQVSLRGHTSPSPSVIGSRTS